jgi:hypothetical protein
MPEKLRVTCPLCGLTPFLSTVEENEKKPVDMRLFVLKFGGKVKSPPLEPPFVIPHRGGGPGYMELIDISKEDPDQLKAIINKMKQRAQQFINES